MDHLPVTALCKGHIFAVRDLAAQDQSVQGDADAWRSYVSFVCLMNLGPALASALLRLLLKIPRPFSVRSMHFSIQKVLQPLARQATFASLAPTFGASIFVARWAAVSHVEPAAHHVYPMTVIARDNRSSYLVSIASGLRV